MAVANGTVALEAAVALLDLAPGDEVLLPTFTIVSCLQAVLYAGAVPVLVDADPETWCMDLRRLEEAVGPRTRAVMPVHIYGLPVEMDPVLELAERRGLAVVEDAAEAHGAEVLTRRGGERWARCGSFGTVSAFSFYANKIVTTGEGGMLLTDDDGLAARARSLRNLCFGREERFRHERLGHNFRLTNLQAAIGLAQVETIGERLARKRAIGDGYRRRLEGLPGIRFQPRPAWARPVDWMVGILLDEATGATAAEMGRRLAARGVETRPFFLGMHAQPALRRAGIEPRGAFPVADRLARQGLYLPSGASLTEAHLDEVAGAVRDALAAG